MSLPTEKKKLARHILLENAFEIKLITDIWRVDYLKVTTENQPVTLGCPACSLKRIYLRIRLMHRDKILEIRKQLDFRIPKDFGRISDCAKGSRQTNKRPDPKTVHKVLALKRMD